jgi:cation diffusion facilitator family transporter
VSEESKRVDRFGIGERASWGAALGNLGLVIFKLVAGLLGHSAAMVADAMHSTSDILASLGVIASLRISKRPADEGHPYGHGKAESVAAKLVGITLLVAGFSIGFSAIKSILAGTYVKPGMIALVAAIVSVVTKEAMYQVVAATARRIHSSALLAEAWHHRSDAYSSIGTGIGIFAARHGWPILDPIAGLVVALLIASIGWKTLRSSAQELMDAQVDEEILCALRQTTLDVEGVHDIHTIAARRYGGSYYVDLRIGADSHLSLEEGHEIAMQVEIAIKRQCERVVGVLVHVDPESVHRNDPAGDGHAMLGKHGSSRCGTVG